MNATDRTFFIKHAFLRALQDCGAYPVREETLREQAVLKVDYLQPTTAEMDAVLRTIDADRLAVALPSERGRKLKLTDAGRLWLAENS